MSRFTAYSELAVRSLLHPCSEQHNSPDFSHWVYRLYMLKFWFGEATQTVSVGVFRLPTPVHLSSRLIDAACRCYFDQPGINLSIVAIRLLVPIV